MNVRKVKRKSREREEIGKPDEGSGAQDAFFEVSKVVETPEMLQSWAEWFTRLNIPWAVARASGGYTLWRKGEEIGRARARASVLERKNIVYSSGV